MAGLEDKYGRLLAAYEILKQEHEELKRSHIALCWADHQKAEEIKRQAETVKGCEYVIDTLKMKLDEERVKAGMIEKLERELAEYERVPEILEWLKNIDDDSVVRCKKIRCCDEEEARAWAETLHIVTGEDFIVYQCRQCHPNRRTNSSFWHASHADPYLRGRHQK